MNKKKLIRLWKSFVSEFGYTNLLKNLSTLRGHFSTLVMSLEKRETNGTFMKILPQNITSEKEVPIKFWK